MSEGEKRGRGRPPKAPEKGKRQNYTFRLHDSTRERLLATADAANRTLSEEIEYRVEKSFEQEERIASLFENQNFDDKLFRRMDNKINELMEALDKQTESFKQMMERRTLGIFGGPTGDRQGEGILGELARAEEAPGEENKE